MFDNTEIAFSHLSDKALKKAWWLFKAINVNFLVKTGPALTNFALKAGLPVLPLIRSTIFAHFCGGETIEECEDNIANLWEYGVGTILDYSVEGEKTEAAFEQTAAEIIATIHRARKDNKVPFSVFKVTGIARFELLAKITAAEPLSTAELEEFDRAARRADRICRESFTAGIPVLVDAEESWIQSAIDRLVLDMMEKYNRETAIVFNTYQLYRNDSLDILKANIKTAGEAGFYLGAKLVRGAYMEKERERAGEKGYPSPIHVTKQESDRDFDAAVAFCLDHIQQVAFMAGTHNETSCRKLVERMKEKQLSPGDKRIWFGQLLGMSDNISFNLAHAGYRVAKYVPYGPVKSVLPYLFRRARENTAISGQMSRELRLVNEELRRRKDERKVNVISA
ncbi:L-proline dehydrogenase [Anseongella ginsenosidimutans]|uniref:L-proline dehydrogenase n=1 Tax=Anseongella ginsenosidimutans TaxID=496056 RepID=A0A4R3KQS7_9SPHI|nr:proline dehydrogenase family protein [Anseongella ginsenosidimutans]QEC52653.1 proline dehydrogenase [Anseongella ginsenosidimutans]TCS86579.1 L-proline dehydrogenase [Anseongella ginsenosidimutans]